ncbi:MAG: glycosyltransferase family 4 protein [Chloroflexi bacterium]|nr:glycosyltransferase family 4 protein [Chloroflexota bacterium]
MKKIIDNDIQRNQSILLVANWDWVLYNFRLPLAKMLQDNGLDVILVCPPGHYTDAIVSQGFYWKPWNLSRRSIYPWREAYSVLELYRIYRDLRPVAVHHFTIKPILYGSVAARLARIKPVINNFTGLGYLFSDAPKANFLRKLLLPLLHRALRVEGFHTAFQNEQDLAQLVSLGMITGDDTTLIPGTGVDITRYQLALSEPNLANEPPVVIMAARLLWDKGVAEYVEAARQIRELGIAADFWFAGDPDPGNPACVPMGVLDEWREEGIVKFLGHRADIPDLLQEADIAVLPSYHEGVPLFLLEAAASGLPLVGSDIEGCRVVIDNGVNGCLVQKENAEALAQALKELLLNPALRRKMGSESRRIAEQRFDQRIILDRYLDLYKKLNLLQAREVSPVLLVANWDWVLYNFRLPLASALEENGLSVILICPPGKYTDSIQQLGYQWQPWDLNRRSIAPWSEVISILELYKIYRQLKPIAVHHFTIKPILYGSLAARAADVPRVVNNFTGLGYLFSEARKAAFLRRIVLPILRRTLSSGSGFHTAFQNARDQAHLVSLGIVQESDTTLIPGTGVNLTQYKPAAQRENGTAPPVVIMAARLLWDKGVGEYVAAARAIRSRGIEARFLLAGEPDYGNPDSISDAMLAEWQHDDAVEVLGHRSDIPALLQGADIAVLPSSYHEGVPLFLLEAAATGLALIGSDIEGCRMVIEHGENGFLIPKKDTESLTQALTKLLSDPELRSEMGQASRRVAEIRFDQRLILKRYIQMYQEMNLLPV